jgi:hypothetical protein
MDENTRKKFRDFSIPGKSRNVGHSAKSKTLIKSLAKSRKGDG